MNQENYVLFKGTKDGVTVVFDAEAPFEELCEQLKKKVEEAGKFFDNVKTTLAFKGRTFTDEEEAKLVEIITEHTSMQITFLKTENTELKQLTELIEKQVEPHTLTKFHKGSLRNGQRIDFDGSIVVIGDINAGAEIRATGNIIVLGQLKGLAHAGYKGMTDAFVAAVFMAPVQLRIADIITRFPEENKRAPKPAEYAFVQDGQIFVMPLA